MTELMMITGRDKPRGCEHRGRRWRCWLQSGIQKKRREGEISQMQEIKGREIDCFSHSHLVYPLVDAYLSCFAPWLLQLLLWSVLHHGFKVMILVMIGSSTIEILLPSYKSLSRQDNSHYILYERWSTKREEKKRERERRSGKKERERKRNNKKDYWLVPVVRRFVLFWFVYRYLILVP